jgi:hypothetical protein
METHDPKRRIILISTLAAGATFVLHGCKGKQEEAATGGESGASPTGGAPAAPEAARPMDQEPTPKMSQEGAQYQNEPLGEQKCANCTNFIADSKTCKVVEGEISPNGWCILWTGA